MSTITMTAKELKNRTGDAFRAIARGDEVVLTRRGNPVARMTPMVAAPPEVPSFDEAWAEIDAALADTTPEYETLAETMAATRRRS